MTARLSHGQFLGGTFDSSQRVSSPLYFRQLQSTGGSGSRHRSPGRMTFTLDSFTKIDGIVVPSHPLESEDSAISTQGYAPTASGIAAVSLGQRSQFLDGLTPTDRNTILAAATRRRFFANSVITKSGSPCRPSFPAGEGSCQIFLRCRRGQEASLSVDWTRRFIRRSDYFVGPFYLSLRHRNSNG